MFQNIIKSTQNLFQQLITFNNETKIEIKNDKHTSIHNNSDDNKTVREKIFFQPNSIFASESIDCGVKSTANDKDIIQRIIIECNYNTILQLDKICRYFEFEQNTAIMRGLWMLSLVKEIELSNKKLGVITLDESNIVVDVYPINVV